MARLMIKRKRDSAAQRKRRQRRKESISAVKLKLLSEDAPTGTYRIDGFVEELSSAGAKYQNASEFLRELRFQVWFAGDLALVTAKNHFEFEPNLRRSAKQLFSDLKRIQDTIERIKKHDKSYIFLAIEPSHRRPYPNKGPIDQIDDLLQTSLLMSKNIEIFLSAYKPRAKPGNYEPLTRGFLAELVEVWCKIISGVGSVDENKLFFRFLIAAWQDLNFPSKEAQGQTLAEWLSDRLRKQFPKGVRAIRLSEQNLDMQDFE
jgi:hypothetical protein